MNRNDRAAWKSAVTWADLGERVVGWLNGRITQTPGHLGPPDPETIPLIPVLTAVNRAGFVTDNSQSADGPWEAWVTGFATDAVLDGLREAVAGTPLVFGACRGCRGCGHRWPGCGRKEILGYWLQRCPRVAALGEAWLVTIADPEPGRNDRLWPALATFAEWKVAS